MNKRPVRTADVTIQCYWNTSRKTWTFVARSSSGEVLSLETAHATAPMDRPGTALVLRAMREELESHLDF